MPSKLVISSEGVAIYHVMYTMTPHQLFPHTLSNEIPSDQFFRVTVEGILEDYEMQGDFQNPLPEAMGQRGGEELVVGNIG